MNFVNTPNHRPLYSSDCYTIGTQYITSTSTRRPDSTTRYSAPNDSVTENAPQKSQLSSKCPEICKSKILVDYAKLVG